MSVTTIYSIFVSNKIKQIKLKGLKFFLTCQKNSMTFPGRNLMEIEIRIDFHSKMYLNATFKCEWIFN